MSVRTLAMDYGNLQGFLSISDISWERYNYFFPLLMVAGVTTGIVLYVTQRKRGVLLCLCAFAMLKSFCMTIILGDLILLRFNRLMEDSQKWYPILLFVWFLLWLITSAWCLVYFGRKDRRMIDGFTTLQHQEDVVTDEGQDVLTDADMAGATGLLSVSNDKRFANYLIDSLLIIFLVSPFLDYLFAFFEGSLVDGNATRTTLYLQALMGTIIYYTIFELLGKSSPGKYLTGTRVIHENGAQASAAQVVGRSFCRLIPFEHFSFLGARGWHDSITKTDVVEIGHAHYGNEANT